MNFYLRHIGDYLKDTAHLSNLEHGIYCRLLDIYYTREAPIPADQVARLVAARTPDDVAALGVVLGEFFTAETFRGVDVFRQTRCDAELENYRQKAEAARVNGRKGGRPKTHDKPSGNPEKTQRVNLASEKQTQAKAIQNPVTSNHEPEATHHSESARASEAKSVSRGTPEPEPFEVFDGFQFWREELKADYPTAFYSQADELMTGRAIEHEVGDGITTREQLKANTRAFRAQQIAANRLGTSFVMNPRRFYGHERHYLGPFAIPEQPSSSTARRVDFRPDPAEDAAALARLRPLAVG